MYKSLPRLTKWKGPNQENYVWKMSHTIGITEIQRIVKGYYEEILQHR